MEVSDSFTFTLDLKGSERYVMQRYMYWFEIMRQCGAYFEFDTDCSRTGSLLDLETTRDLVIICNPLIIGT